MNSFEMNDRALWWTKWQKNSPKVKTKGNKTPTPYNASALEAGKTYYVIGEIVIMPKHPSELTGTNDVYHQIGRVTRLKKATFNVLAVKRSKNTQWYRVRCGEINGWINSIGLLGKEISECTTND